MFLIWYGEFPIKVSVFWPVLWLFHKCCSNTITYFISGVFPLCALYLQWIATTQCQQSIVWLRTLYHRAETICSSPLLLQQKEKHLQKALHRCQYPAWALNRVKIKKRSSAKRRSNTTKTGQNNPNQQKLYMVIPYYRGLSKSLKKICSRHGVQVYFKGGNTIKNLLMAPKYKDPIMKKSGVIYGYRCIGWTVMRNISGNPQGCLVRGLRNIKKHPPLYLTILTPLAITLT